MLSQVAILDKREWLIAFRCRHARVFPSGCGRRSFVLVVAASRDPAVHRVSDIPQTRSAGRSIDVVPGVRAASCEHLE